MDATYDAIADFAQRALNYPGKPSAAILVYVHRNSSVQVHADVLSKADASKLLPEVEKMALMLKSIIDG